MECVVYRDLDPAVLHSVDACFCLPFIAVGLDDFEVVIVVCERHAAVNFSPEGAKVAVLHFFCLEFFISKSKFCDSCTYCFKYDSTLSTR